MYQRKLNNIYFDLLKSELITHKHCVSKPKRILRQIQKQVKLLEIFKVKLIIFKRFS